MLTKLSPESTNIVNLVTLEILFHDISNVVNVPSNSKKVRLEKI